MVYYLLYFRQVNNHVFLHTNLPFYDGIKALADENSPLWIFSLNHDVIVEAIAARLGVKVHSGFSSDTISLPLRDKEGVKKGNIRGHVLTKDTLDNHAMYFPNPPEAGIYLLKIHGALDIFTFNDGNDLLKLSPDGEEWIRVLEVLREANEDLFYPLSGTPGGRAHTLNEISYADDQGKMQFLRRSLLAGAYKFDKRFTQTLPLSMMKHFQANINFVTHLVCIGYGFGDVHINQVLREWLEFTDNRTLEIVSPIAKDVPQFLLHLAPQVKITPKATTVYLDDRAGIERPLRQKIEKRLRDLMRTLQKDVDAMEPRMPGAIRQGHTFLNIVQSLERLTPNIVFANDGPIALAEQWARGPDITQGKLLDWLRQLVEERYSVFREANQGQ
jgi:hypothetical protein